MRMSCARGSQLSDVAGLPGGSGQRDGLGARGDEVLRAHRTGRRAGHEPAAEGVIGEHEPCATVAQDVLDLGAGEPGVDSTATAPASWTPKWQTA
jgi:hypothetical protein